MVSLCEWGFGETIITQLIHQRNHLYIFQHNNLHKYLNMMNDYIRSSQKVQ